MTYTDKQLRIATEIAYFDLHKIIHDINQPIGEGIKILDAIYLYRVRNRGALSKEDNERLTSIIDFLSKPSTEKWMLVDYKNDNNENQSSLYGIVIDTGDGLIVSFRGSEDITDPQHVKQDWVNADLALMNNTLTEQQRVVNEKMNESLFNEKDQINLQ